MDGEDFGKSSELNLEEQVAKLLGEQSDLAEGGSQTVIDLQSPRGGIVTARGTADGLIIRLDGRVSADDLQRALRDFLVSRKGFLEGNPITVEWVGRQPADSIAESVTRLLTSEFKIEVKSSRLHDTGSRSSGADDARGADGIADGELLKSSNSALSTEEGAVLGKDRFLGSGGARTKTHSTRPVSLFDGVEALSLEEALEEGQQDMPAVSGVGAPTQSAGEEPTFWDDPDTRMFYGTLRSGQKVETEHSLVVCGDVNSGAEVVAGGDIVVLGTLRGVAHAGAYDETGGGRFIFALELQATQLRIGTVISRGGAEEGGSSGAGRSAEVARVEGDLIVVERYQSRSGRSRGRVGAARTARF